LEAELKEFKDKANTFQATVAKDSNTLDSLSAQLKKIKSQLLEEQDLRARAEASVRRLTLEKNEIQEEFDRTELDRNDIKNQLETIKAEKQELEDKIALIFRK